MNLTKICKRCNLSKDISNFHKATSIKDGLMRDCKSCNKERKAAYMLSDGYAAKVKNYRLKRIYNISLEEYTKLLLSQDNKCKICNRDKSNCHKGLYVDHCHKTNKIRGLLCNDCNIGLGKFKDNIIAMKAAIKYLSEN